MKLTELEQQLFAVLFASGEPMEMGKFYQALEVNQPQLEAGIKSLQYYLQENHFPIQIKKLGDSYQLCTKTEFHDMIKKTLEIKRNIPLSPAAMEVLAIIAYNQPVTRGFIEQVRGVDSSSIVVSLVEKGLLEEAGRMELPGRPISYRTTYHFLRCFGLTSLEELPEVKEGDGQEQQMSFEEL